MEEKDYYKVKAVSNSGMGSINPDQGGTPRKYKKYIIDQTGTPWDTPSLENGRVIHLYVEDPSKFCIANIDKPTETIATWVEAVYKLIDDETVIDSSEEGLKAVVMSCKGDRYKRMKEDTVWTRFCREGFDYLKFLQKVKDKIVITPDTKKIVEGVITGIKENPFANILLFNESEDFGDIECNEFPVYWTEKVNGVDLECKALIDRVKISPLNKKIQLIDFKTTGKPGTLFSRSFKQYRYYRQLAFYNLAIRRYVEVNYPDIPWGDWTVENYIVSSETSGLYQCHVHYIRENNILAGRKEYTSLLERIAYHYDINEWKYSIEEIKNKGFLYIDYEEEK